MEIRLGSLLGDARHAEGTTVIIDVFRAFTTAAIAFSRGARRIVMVAEPEEALELRDRRTGDLCIGEVDGMRPGGFDLGNSPFEMSQADVEGKTLIQSTRAGTMGVSAAGGADRIYAASLVTAGATARAVCLDAPELVTIVAMGVEAGARADEDEQCALYLRNLLEGRKPSEEAVRSVVMEGGQTQKFFDPAQNQYHPEDVELALQLNRYPFAMRITHEDELLVARKVGF